MHNNRYQDGQNFSLVVPKIICLQVFDDFPDYRAAVRDGNASRVLFLEHVESSDNTSVRKSRVQTFRLQKFKFSLLWIFYRPNWARLHLKLPLLDQSGSVEKCVTGTISYCNCRETSPRVGVDTQQSFIRGDSALWSKPLPLFAPFLTPSIENGSPFTYLQ